MDKPKVVECLKFNNEYFEKGEVVHITQCMGYNDCVGRILRFDSKESCGGDYKKIIFLDTSEQYKSKESYVYFDDIRNIKRFE